MKLFSDDDSWEKMTDFCQSDIGNFGIKRAALDRYTFAKCVSPRPELLVSLLTKPQRMRVLEKVMNSVE